MYMLHNRLYTQNLTCSGQASTAIECMVKTPTLHSPKCLLQFRLIDQFLWPLFQAIGTVIKKF